MSVTLNASTSSGLVQTADTSGTIELQSNGTTKLSVLSTGVSGVITSGTAVASTSGTSIDFTSIPSWVKRITVIFNGVSGNGTSHLLIQLGTGSTTYTTSGYNSASTVAAGSVTTVSSTAGLIVWQNLATFTLSGTMTLTNITGNTWISNTTGKLSTTETVFAGGDIALGAVLTAVRITRVNGTDTFDAGSINILYEG